MPFIHLPLIHPETPIRAVVFDRDDTLLRYDTDKLIALFRQAVPDLSLSDLARHWARLDELPVSHTRDEPRFWQRFWGQFVNGSDLPPDTAARLTALSREFPSVFSAYSDTLACLRGLLQRGLRLAILTNHPLATEPALRTAGVDPAWFSAIVSAHPDNKPAPAAYRKVLRELALPAQECLFVDDEAENVLGALAVGMPAVRIDRSGAHRGDPDTIECLADLLDLPAPTRRIDQERMRP
jgi:HAD superfamily hydrolase (TIGR01509 family)